ncbi:MAG: deoxyribonuclease IV [Deltaproteobacteria bacterium]|nr:deoxyribonuclease IV [Deltaproteobacteria bacterium]
MKKLLKKSYLLGAHFSIVKGLHRAIYTAELLHCNILQIFTKNSSTWKEKNLSQNEIDDFKKAKKETGIITIASHTSYLINLAGHQKKKHLLSCNALKQELIRSSKLGIDYVVLHPGSHMGKGEDYGLCRIADSINKIFDETPKVNTQLLLETSSGQGSSIGHTFKHLAIILDRIKNNDKVGICLDTCHIFAAGYDIRTKQSYAKTINEFIETIGLKHLKLIHLNDSKKALGSRIDRHEHIGKGKIGLDAFRWIMNDPRLLDVPKIIETPKGNHGNEMDTFNLNQLKGFIN